MDLEVIAGVDEVLKRASQMKLAQTVAFHEQNPIDNNYPITA